MQRGVIWSVEHRDKHILAAEHNDSLTWHDFFVDVYVTRFFMFFTLIFGDNFFLINFIEPCSR